MERDALIDDYYDDILFCLQNTYQSRLRLRAPIVKKMNDIVRLGDSFDLDNQDCEELSDKGNCLLRACYPRLTKKQVEALGLDDLRYTFMNPFGEFDDSSIESAKREMFEFISQTGLIIQKDKKILKANERRVALYFTEAYSKGFGRKDFHFLFQERNGSWSGKRGCDSNIVDTFPKLETELPFEAANKYKLDSVIVIKNPYAPAERQK